MATPLELFEVLDADLSELERRLDVGRQNSTSDNAQSAWNEARISSWLNANRYPRGSGHRLALGSSLCSALCGLAPDGRSPTGRGEPARGNL